MAMSYWAVRPISTADTGANTRIEKAATPRSACVLAFGYFTRATFQAKNLGTRVAIIQSDNKRIALLRDPSGWEVII